MTAKQLYVYDFTLPLENMKPEDLFSDLQELCKKWVFQPELSHQTKYEHFQGKFSLRTRARLTTVRNKMVSIHERWSKVHLSPTVTENTRSFDYVMKADSRMGDKTYDDRWYETFQNQYIPRQYKVDKLRPFQSKILYMATIFHPRKINLIINECGDMGKSTIAHILRLLHDGIVLPICNDAEKLIQSACNMLMARKIRKTIPISIDLPRAMNQSKLNDMYTAIEQIKSGYVYDVRNHFKSWDFDSPTIFVFTNKCPPINMLTENRWSLFEIDNEYELQSTTFAELNDKWDS